MFVSIDGMISTPKEPSIVRKHTEATNIQARRSSSESNGAR